MPRKVIAEIVLIFMGKELSCCLLQTSKPANWYNYCKNSRLVLFLLIHFVCLRCWIEQCVDMYIYYILVYSSTAAKVHYVFISICRSHCHACALGWFHYATKFESARCCPPILLEIRLKCYVIFFRILKWCLKYAIGPWSCS